MTVSKFSEPPSPVFARALEEFEPPFVYPLGPGKSFHISHGVDYARFFRAIGNGMCFVAEHAGRVVGTLGTAVRALWLPNGDEHDVAYIGDLKVAVDNRGGLVLVRLARAAEAWLSPQVTGAFAVVMDGTAQTPLAYTGRVGIPSFQVAGRISVLRLSCPGSHGKLDSRALNSAQSDGLACYRRLSRGRHACPAVAAHERSLMTPHWLVHPEGTACGMLEDTRKAKRLLYSDGSEMLSAHLTCFASSTPAAGAEIIRLALGLAALHEFPSLFVAVAEPDVEELRVALRGVDVLAAPATIYATGLGPGTWNINSAEI